MMPGGGNPALSPAKYIYVTRNPKDVAVSFYYHTKRFEYSDFTGDWDEYFECFIKGDVDFGLWFDHVLGWWSHKGQQLFVIIILAQQQSESICY